MARKRPVNSGLLPMIKTWASTAIAFDSTTAQTFELGDDDDNTSDLYFDARDVTVVTAVAGGYDDTCALAISNDGGTTYVDHTTGINTSTKINIDETVTDIKVTPTGGGAAGTITFKISARVFV